MRWKDYFLVQDDNCRAFWSSYLEEKKKVLFILGKGFDPRMCAGLKSILENTGCSVVDCTLIDFADGSSYAPNTKLEENNRDFNRLRAKIGVVKEIKIQTRTDNGRAVGPKKALNIFTNSADFDGYSDVIVDISSLPLNIYFPLIGKILYLIDTNSGTPVLNLHVMATENILIDKCINKVGLSDNATYLHGFVGNVNLESEAKTPLVWIPILGEKKSEQIERIYELVRPNEICPVLPFPSTNSRRGDNIILEYGNLLDRLQVETGNIIYGSEQNPFVVYRQICKTIKYYSSVLKPMGNPRFVISSLSSKLMSMGAFFAAYEEGLSNKKKVGVAYVETTGYEMNGCDKKLPICNSLFSMWISGDCYE